MGATTHPLNLSWYGGHRIVAQLQQDKNTEESRTTQKGRRRHDKRAGVQGAPQIVIFIWYTTDDYTGPQHEARRRTPPRRIVSVSMWREGICPSPSCQPNLTRRGGHGLSLSCLCPKDAARRVMPLVVITINLDIYILIYLPTGL